MLSVPGAVGDDTWIIRGIPTDGVNPETGTLTTMYFKSDELSMWLLSAAAVCHLLSLRNFEELAAVRVGHCRELGLTVTRTPEEDGITRLGQAEHVSVYMPKPGRTGRANSLRQLAVRAVVSDKTPERLFDDLSRAIPVQD